MTLDPNLGEVSGVIELIGLERVWGTVEMVEWGCSSDSETVKQWLECPIPN